MSYRVIRLIALAYCCLCVTIQPAQAIPKPQKLNNFVTKLLSVRLNKTVQKEYIFTNPRAGWVFFSLTTSKSSSGKIRVLLDNQPSDIAIIIQDKQHSSEAMRRLPVGNHKIKILADGKPNATLTIRTMPEIMFIRFTGDVHSPDGSPYRTSTREANGADRLYLYYWDFLSKTILKNVNVISGTPGPSEIIQWKKEGKEIVDGAWFFTKDPEELYQGWSKSFKAPAAGLIADEFVPPDTGFENYIIDTISRIHDASDLKGTFYAYIGFPYGSKAEDFRKLMEPLMRCNYRWVPEVYLFEQPSLLQAKDNLDKLLRQRMLDFRKTYPGSEKSCVVCPSILEAWDVIPNVDYKVWLDMQFNIMANDPAFEGLYGVTAYQSIYADPEIIRWLSALYRHYCIDGQKSMLSSQFGYTYIADHIMNGLFAENEKDWTFTPAQNGSIGIKKIGEIPFKKGYLPIGNNLLWTKRSQVKPNTISQEIKNLKPGKLYSLRMFICEPRDSGITQKYAVSINLPGAKVLPDRSLQDIQRGEGTRSNTACWNYIYRVFRAVSSKAMLEISDWSGPTTPGGPIDQEIIYDFIQVQPLFEGN